MSDLVKGYATFSGFTRLDGTRLFQHSAVFSDGRVAVTLEAFPESEREFDTIGREWSFVPVEPNALENLTLSQDMHFLGNYPAPSIIHPAI